MRTFLEEVSEVMQFHVRKLYTAEGRRVRSRDSWFKGFVDLFILTRFLCS